MRLNELTLQHYRNYETVSLDFPKTLNLFLGENAQGKTNLLESIYVLAMTRSHRTSNEKELIGWEQAAAKISGVVEKKTGTVPLEILISNKGRKTKVNHIEQKRLSAYIGQLNVILFAPEDLSLVKGSPQVRRGLEFEAKRQGTFILFHGFNELKDIDLLQRNWNFDGFIIIGAFKNIITELVKKISKPMVFIDSYYDLSIQNPQILFVNNDDRKLAYEATKVLLNYGYRNIAFFSPAFSLKDDGVVPQRYLGYLDALLEFGLAADDKLLFSEEKLTNFIEAEETYSASIINSDYLAAQYLYKLRERNQQFKSLISFDNNIFSQLLNPPLSTVDLRQKEKGRIAVKLINDMLQRSEKQFERNIMIEGQLISRESVLERTE